MTNLPTFSDVGTFPGGAGVVAAATTRAGVDGSENPEVGGDAVLVPTESDEVDELVADETVSTTEPAATEEATPAELCSKCNGPVSSDEWPEASSISPMSAAKTAAAVAALASLLGYLSMYM